jgi:hypothetical protein
MGFCATKRGVNNWGRLKANNIKAIENRNFMRWGPLEGLIVSRFKSKPGMLVRGAKNSDSWWKKESGGQTKRAPERFGRP